jgi:molybdenum cofactor cytidylyltransferase
MISAIVLAAGESTRFGECKQLARIGDKALLEHTLQHLRASRIDEIAVILGAHAEAIKTHVRFDRERVIVNPHYAEGISTSIQAGLRAINGKAALVVLGDQPFVRPETLDLLIAEYERSRSKIVIPTYDGVRGNPVLVDRSLFAEMMNLRGDVGFRVIFSDHADAILKVPVDDRGVVTDIDTPADLSTAPRV